MTVRIAQPHVRFGDPHVTSDDPSRLSIHACVYEALVRRGAGGHFRDGLATDYTLSADARTWRFVLRPAMFHDGQALKAEDVVFSLRRVRDEVLEGELGTSGVFQRYLRRATVAVDDEQTVVLTTATPTADLLDLLVDIPIIPRSYNGHPVGTGPYRVLESGSDRVVLERAGDGMAHTPRGMKELPARLEYIGIADPEARLGADADVATDVAPGAPGEVRAATTVCTTFLCNLERGPCTSRAFRQALNWAVDVPTLIREELGGAAVPIQGPLTSRHLGVDGSTPGYTFKPSEARRLLESSGIVGGKITLDVPTRLPDEAQRVAARLAEYYAAVGIDCEIAVHEDRPAYADRVRDKGIHDAACFDSSPSSTFRVLWEKFHSGHRGPWWQGYQNPEVDRLVDQARASPDIARRQLLYGQAFGILSRDAPWIFLYNPSRCFAVAPRLAGWTPSPDGYAIFH
ncbi:MAG: peptide/nickel transport system substrate-binding protein [Rhodothermales bacterium]